MIFFAYSEIIKDDRITGIYCIKVNVLSTQKILRKWCGINGPNFNSLKLTQVPFNTYCDIYNVVKSKMLYNPML